MKPKTKKILFILLAVLAFGSLFVSFFSPTIPKLISSTPSNYGNLSDPNLPLILQFNAKVNLNNFSFTTTPTENLKSELINPNTVKINFNKPLRLNTKYLLTIKHKDKLLAELSYTTNAPQNTQYDARFNQEIQNELDAKYPLIAKTPYSTSQYRVVYSGPMTLEISLKNSSITPEKAFSEIRAWVTSVGGDATAHKYVISDKPLPSTTTPISATPQPKADPPQEDFNWDTLQDDGT